MGMGRGTTGMPGMIPGAAAPTTGTAATESAPARPATNGYQYKIEVSDDGESYKMALDMTKNDVSRSRIYSIR